VNAAKMPCKMFVFIFMNLSQYRPFLREMTSWPPSWNYGVNPKIRLDAYLLEEQSNQISSRSDFKQRSLMAC